ncbi:DEAD/DEAH box helicase [Streptosporangium sp. NPDC087985]|uniref:DEAD/DEAH box helicase n=1 Tax=Streptosporangium sp. NPDC087985 TaxID=3366196 RepID=UPI00381B2252
MPETPARWRGLSLLYVCPIKALLNNLLPRLEGYASWTGHRVALWHGDVSGSRRKKILRDPPDVLLTTPESIESMLVGVNVDHRQLFEHLQAIVVDQIYSASEPELFCFVVGDHGEGVAGDSSESRRARGDSQEDVAGLRGRRTARRIHPLVRWPQSPSCVRFPQRGTPRPFPRLTAPGASTPTRHLTDAWVLASLSTRP